MKILLTGAGGQVGHEVQRIANARACPIDALRSSELEITDLAAIRRCVKDQQPGIIINAAAYTAVDKAEDEPRKAFAVNREGAANLAQVAAQSAIPLIHLSTDYVFDGSKTAPYTEADALSPLGIYGRSKSAGEAAVRERLAQHVIIRVSWVFGFYGKNFVKTMLKLARERDELNVVMDQFGGPTYAGHIASLLLRLYQLIETGRHVQWGTYHYCDTPITSWHGFAEAVVREGRRQGLVDHPVRVNPLTTEEYPTRARRPANSALDCGKIKTVFGIEQQDWGAGLRDMLGRIARSTQGDS